jgi:glycosyltransferase involved in cell wall biosynthesis
VTDGSANVQDGGKTLCVVVASNDEPYLRQNLLASEFVQSGAVVHVERGASSAGAAYNRGLDATSAPIVVFAHQDVYFPPGWDRLLWQTLADIERADPDWALVAPFGVSNAGEHIGDVWTTSLGLRLGGPFAAPVPAQSFDELVIVMRRSAGLRFDEALPGFHLYGTDIVQTAWARGRGAYVAWLPVVHNDKFHGILGADFTASYQYLWRKWRRRLPLLTPVLWVRWHGWSLDWYRWFSGRSIEKRRATAGDSRTDPRQFSLACGWEDASWTKRRAPLPPPPPTGLRRRVRLWLQHLF